ncbi:hypothetical protein [Mycobacterium sp. 3519A]|uniref:hypothetical protein n=1 Tax=Mycobacterium sp. 3519A TaxID=2057184 RepID=UPI000C7B9AD6|nr:hypothetical protein [Mycobacterium sp. 3519A]
MFAAACIAFAITARDFWDYTLDDAYISFRYAQNWADGSGLVFNAGEYPRAEGITSPLWAIVLSTGVAAKIDPLLLAKCLGVMAVLAASAIVVVTVFKVLRGSTTLSVGMSSAFAMVAAASLISSPYMAVNSVSGMETVPAVAAYAAFLLNVLRTMEFGARRSVAVVTGFCAVAVPMVRPEMLLAVAVTLLGAFLIWRSSRANVALSFASFVSIGVVYFLIRYAYYGLPVPLPFYIKQGGFDFPGWGDVSDYAKYAVLLGLSNVVAIGFATCSIAGKQGRPAAAAILAISAGATAQMAYYATVHHIMGFGFRYLMPVSVAFTIAGAVGLGMLCARIATRTGLRTAVLAATVVALLTPNGLALPPTKKLVTWYSEGKPLTEIATAMRDAGVGSLSLAINDCGVIPYVTRSRVLDLAGLNDRTIARGHRGHAHEAAVLEVLSARPDLVLLVASRVNDPSSVSGFENLSDADMRSLGYLSAATEY